jgi:hypothetical protein
VAMLRAAKAVPFGDFVILGHHVLDRFNPVREYLRLATQTGLEFLAALDRRGSAAMAHEIRATSESSRPQVLSLMAFAKARTISLFRSISAAIRASLKQ